MAIMAILVLKFGGTSVGDLERINHVADIIKAEANASHGIVAVVSAMSGVTNQLIDYCRQISVLHDSREYDAVVSSGELVTAGLLSIALQDRGINARSWTGWQLPIETDGSHGKARIENIETVELKNSLSKGEVPVIAGFQGMGPDKRITTLGRGGTDTTAVAISAALRAERCDIYTDVEGVYTSDPRIVSAARKLDRITYEEMLEMASLGARVLQTRSVELAMKHRVMIQVRSSFSENAGTLVCDEEDIVEKETVSGIAYSNDEAKITLMGVDDRPGVAASVFGALADSDINVDMIVQNVAEDGSTDITFTVARADLDLATDVIGNKSEIGCREMTSDSSVVKVSVIGVGMRSHAGVAQTMFRALADKGINIQVISTSEIKVSVLISEEYTELALRSLHTAYGLDAE